MMCPGAMKHPDAEIPQEKAAVVTNTAESICLLVTAPGVKCHRRHPGVMALASCNNFALGE